MKKILYLLLAICICFNALSLGAMAEIYGEQGDDVIMLYDGEGFVGNGYEGIWGEAAGADTDYFTEGTAGWAVSSFADCLMFFQNTEEYLEWHPDLEEYDYVEFDLFSYFDRICNLELSIVNNVTAHHGSDYEMFEVYLPAETFVHVKLPLKDFVVYSMENRDSWDTENDIKDDDPDHYAGYSLNKCARLRWQFTHIVDPDGIPVDENYMVFDNVIATKNDAGSEATLQYWADVKPPEEPNEPDQPITSPTDTPTNTNVLDLGDINGDQSIDAKDALVALRIAVEKYLPTDDEKVAADVNKDKAVDAKDALEILKYAVKKPSVLDK